MSQGARAKLAFIVPGPPVGKERPRLGKGGNVYTPEKTARYEQMVKVFALQAIRQHGSWIVGSKRAMSLTLVVVFPNTRQADVDNVVKAVGDSGNRLIWHDDRQIAELHVYRRYDAAKPRIEVTVNLVDE